MINSENANPNPEFLIKSIAEQGYSLETALADLIDNSISANADKIEILINFEEEPCTLYLSDNGVGMDEALLKSNMLFPSNSIDATRNSSDMGRFGLGMKTASFSQTRRFTVITRKKGSSNYSARTWDVNFLKESGEWKILINSQVEIKAILNDYKSISSCHLNRFNEFETNTLIVWKGLYKFDYLNQDIRKNSLKKQITETTSDYLSLVFHRYMEKKVSPLKIRINNHILSPFNPFPTQETDLRPIEYKQKCFFSDLIKIEGFVLPSRSIDESTSSLSIWTTKRRSLIDMEGIYIYRANRLIFFGGWLGLIRKSTKLQLARLRFEVGNKVDHLLHLNVSKSQITIPHDLKNAFENYIEILKSEAEREFFNRGTRTHSINNKLENKALLFEKKATNKGLILELNSNFPLIKQLKEELSQSQIFKFNLLIRMVNIAINKIRQSHEDKSFTAIEENDGIALNDLVLGIKFLQAEGLSSESIKTCILSNLGFNIDSLPNEIGALLKRE